MHFSLSDSVLSNVKLLMLAVDLILKLDLTLF